MSSALELIKAVVANQQSYATFVYYLMAILHTALKNDAVVHYMEQIRQENAQQTEDSASRRDALNSLLGDEASVATEKLVVTDDINSTSLELSSSSGSFVAKNGRLYAKAFVTIYDRIHRELETNVIHASVLLDSQFLVKSEREWSAGEEGAYPVIYTDKEIQLIIELAKEDDLCEEELELFRKQMKGYDKAARSKRKKREFLGRALHQLKDLQLKNSEEQFKEFMARMSRRVDFHDFSKSEKEEEEKEKKEEEENKEKEERKSSSRLSEKAVYDNGWLFQLYDLFTKMNVIKENIKYTRHKLDEYDLKLKKKKQVSEENKLKYDDLLSQVNTAQQELRAVQKEIGSLFNTNLCPFFCSLVRQLRSFFELIRRFLDVQTVMQEAALEELHPQPPVAPEPVPEPPSLGSNVNALRSDFLSMSTLPPEPAAPTPPDPHRHESSSVYTEAVGEERMITVQLTEANLRELETHLESDSNSQHHETVGTEYGNGKPETKDMYLYHTNQSAVSTLSSSWSSVRERVKLHRKIEQTREIYFRFFFFDNLYHSLDNIFVRFQLVFTYLLKTMKDCDYDRYLSDTLHDNSGVLDKIRQIMFLLSSNAHQRHKKPYTELNGYMFVFRKRLEQLRWRGRQIREAEEKIYKYSLSSTEKKAPPSAKGVEGATKRKTKKRLMRESKRQKKLEIWKMELDRRENAFRMYVHLSFRNGIKEMFILYENLLYIISNYLDYALTIITEDY